LSYPARSGTAFPTSFHPLAGRTVLQIIPELEAGGAERTSVDIAAGLAAAGARALVATEGGRLVGELQAKGGVWVPFPAATKNPFSMLLNVRRLARICHDESVSLIHARSRAPAWVGLGAARALNLPFVTTYHGSYSGRSSVKVLYNSVMALRKAWGVAPHERIVLLAARLTGWKGQKVLIEAAARLRDAGLSDVAYVLAGDPQGRDSYTRDLDNLIATRNLKGTVRRVGHCTDMPAAFLAASVVTVPSTEPEAFGRSAVEAQAMGTPVVVSDLGAVPETVLAPPAVPPHERTGWRVPAGDAAALAEAVGVALGVGASARGSLAQRARAHVERQFSLEHMVSGTLQVYAELLDRTRRPSPPARG
jgi:glycosyltransferase involved in cell wall biosynthesis